jgi:predicted DNA-binding protein with PD1-like motif
MKVVPLRFRPGDDLRLTLEAWMGQQRERAGCLLSGIGSLAVTQLRLAGRNERTILASELEILCLAGTLAADGAHLHIAVADHSGAMTGGHLCVGSLVRTTAQLVVGLLPDWQFSRQRDPDTGWVELQIRQAPEPDPAAPPRLDRGLPGATQAVPSAGSSGPDFALA